MPAWSSTLSIREVAARSGLAPSALRFYEARGLIVAHRARSGHRRYHRAVLRRLAFIVFAQRTGLTLGEIREELARLPHDRPPGREDWSAIANAWTTRIDARLTQLRRLRDSLTKCIGCGCVSLDRCRVANPLDRAAAEGPGPRYWLG